MRLAEVGGYSINPAAITHVETRTLREGSMPEFRRTMTVLHLVGGSEISLVNVSRADCVKLINEAFSGNG